MPDIFVSHSNKDDDAVNALIQEILARIPSEKHPTFWIDHVAGIGPSEIGQREIDKALEGCPRLLLVVSKDSMASDEVLAEWRAAIFFGHPILLAIIDDIPRSQISSRLRIIQWLDLYQNRDTEIARLVKAIMGERGEDIPEFRRIRITGEMRREHVLIPLSGRDGDVTQILDLLRQPKMPVFITGIGGVGKSRLAAEIALTSPDVDGVVWHTISDVSQSFEVIELLRIYFGLPADSPDDAVWRCLRENHVLVVLDNAEDVLPTDPRQESYLQLVENLLANDTQVLVTSRAEWSAIKSKRIFTPSNLDLFAAIQITKDMAATFDVADVGPHAKEIAIAARLHPRLIEWAVLLMRVLPRDEVLNDLNDLQSSDAQDALNEMIRKTVSRMAEADGGKIAEFALQRLLVCRGGFTYQAAAAITELPNDDLRIALRTLKTWCFVSFDSAKQRYDIPPMVGIAVSTDPHGQPCHYNYYYELAKQHDRSQDYLSLDIESENLMAAFETAIIRSKAEMALRLAEGCEKFLANRIRFKQGIEWLLQIEHLLRDYPDDELSASLNILIGNIYTRNPLGRPINNLERAKIAYSEALNYYTFERSPRYYAGMHNNLGLVYSELAQNENAFSNLQLAKNSFEHALDYYTLENSPAEYAMTMNNLGAVYRSLAVFENLVENLRLAEDAYLKALDYYTVDNAPQDYAGIQNNLGLLYHDLGVHEASMDYLRQAERAFQNALQFFTPETAPRGYGMTQNNLAQVYGSFSKYENSSEGLQKAINIFKELLGFYTLADAPRDYAGIKSNMGEAFKRLADFENEKENLLTAFNCWLEAVDILEKLGVQRKVNWLRQQMDELQHRLSSLT